MDSGPIGRDTEVTKISVFPSATSGIPAAFAVTGDAGIGKSMVWNHAVQASSSSTRVLSSRPIPAERPLAFSALDDLFGDVVEKILPELPGPRRRAVEAAMLLDASTGRSSAALSGPGRTFRERRALAHGVLGTLRALSHHWPLMVAVDDAQWLDRPSAGVLEFCFRRLKREPVSVLLTFRNADLLFPLGLDRALPPDRLGHVRLDPVSLGAIGEILRSRLGAALSRYNLLLQCVLYVEMRPNERRQVHQRLGTTTGDVEERAWHLALAAERPLRGYRRNARRCRGARGVEGRA